MKTDISILPIGVINELGFDGVIEREGEITLLIGPDKEKDTLIGRVLDSIFAPGEATYEEQERRRVRMSEFGGDVK